MNSQERYFKITSRVVMKFLLPASLIALIFLSACPESPTNPQDENPYKQEPIDWPSLADSPWPMWRGNPMGNGLSFDKGPEDGMIIWEYTPTLSSGGGLGLALDSLNNIYTVTKNGHLVSLDFNGNLRWDIPLMKSTYFNDDGECSPIVLKGNRIAVGINTSFYIFNVSGEVQKSFTLPSQFKGSGFQVDKDGYFYALFNDNTIKSFDLDGNIRWELSGYGGYSSGHVPVFLPNGSAIIAPAENSVDKISTGGIIEWQYPCKNASPVIVSSNSEIYFYNESDTSITCLGMDGEKKWNIYYYSDRLSTISAPNILINGTIVYSATQFLGIKPEGSELWWSKDDGYSNWIDSDLISDVDGNVYGIVHCGSVYKINKDGELQWTLEGSFCSCGSPAIVNGRMFFTDFNEGVIYAVE